MGGYPKVRVGLSNTTVFAIYCIKYYHDNMLIKFLSYFSGVQEAISYANTEVNTKFSDKSNLLV